MNNATSTTRIKRMPTQKPYDQLLTCYTRKIFLIAAERRLSSQTTYYKPSAPVSSLLVWNLKALQRALCVATLDAAAVKKALIPSERAENQQIINACRVNIKTFVNRATSGTYKPSSRESHNHLTLTRKHIVAALQPCSLIDPSIERRAPLFTILSIICGEKSILSPEDVGLPATLSATEAAQAFSNLCEKRTFANQLHWGECPVSDGALAARVASSGRRPFAL